MLHTEKHVTLKAGNVSIWEVHGDEATSLLLIDIDFNGSMMSMNQNRGDQPTNLHFNITCAEGYYLSNKSGVCRPLCSLWVEPLHIDSNYVAVVAAVIIGVLSLAVAVVVVIIQRKAMYVHIKLIQCRDLFRKWGAQYP